MKAPHHRYEPSQRKLSRDEHGSPEVDVFAVGEYSAEFTATMRQTSSQHRFLGLSHIQQYARYPPHIRLTNPSGKRFEGKQDSYSWLCPISTEFDSVCNKVLDHLVPTKRQLTFRVERVAELCTLLHQALRSFGVEAEIQFYFFGSVHLRTVLPEGDNDVAIIIDDSSDPSMEAVLHADFLPKLRDFLTARYPEYVFVTNLVFAEVRLLKLVYEGMNFDITIGQRGGRYTAQFLHHVDLLLGVGHLFKRTLLLLKSWCNFEARIVGAQGGYLGTYSLTVMLMSLMNSIPLSELRKSNPTPAQVLMRFLQYYSTFDFETNSVTIFGPVPLYGRTSFPERNDDYAVTEQILQELVSKYMPSTSAQRSSTPPPDDVSSQASAPASNTSTPRAATSAQMVADTTVSPVLGPGFPLRHMNVLDPLRPGSNLCRGICRSHMLRIQNAFREGYRQMCKQSKEVENGAISGDEAAEMLFSYTMTASKNARRIQDDEVHESLVPCDECTKKDEASPFCVNLEGTGNPLVVFHAVSGSTQTDWSAQIPMPPPTNPVVQSPPQGAQPQRSIPRPSGAPAPFVSHTQAGKSTSSGGRTKDKSKGKQSPTAQKEINLDSKRMFPTLPQ